MLHINISEVEVDTLHEHIGGDEHLFVGIVEHGTVIANTFDGRLILKCNTLSEPINETKFTQFFYFHDV